QAAGDHRVGVSSVTFHLRAAAESLVSGGSMRSIALLLLSALLAAAPARAEEPKKGDPSAQEATDAEKSALEEMLESAEEAEDRPPIGTHGRRGLEKKDNKTVELSNEAS